MATRTAWDKDYELLRRFEGRGIVMDRDDVATLRRAELTLQRWAEQECGDGNEYGSWDIERDEKTDKPYRCYYSHTSNRVQRTAIPDRERGALKRVAALCERLGLYWYHQTDPRGCALYVDVVPLTDQDYTKGVACCA